MVALIDRYRSLIPAPDVVRLLVVLSEMETELRTSGSPRLAVELLLLRWAMMGRTVELQAVIDALGKKPGKGEEGRGKGDPAPVLREAAPVRLPTSPAIPPEKGPLTMTCLSAHCPRNNDDDATWRP